MRFAIVVVMVAALVLPAAGVGVGVTFLNADGEPQGEFNEGDTVICRCRASNPEGSPYTQAQLYDSVERRQVAGNDQDSVSPGDPGGHTFNDVSFTDTGNGAVEYRVTIGNVDRHDNGFRFYCEFFDADGVSSGAGGVAGELTVNWSPPTVQCTDIPDRVSDAVAFQCSAEDGDGQSTGELTLWRNGEEVDGPTVDTSPADPRGTRYQLSQDDVPVTDIDDVYQCRYRASGGLQEYSANCTFNKLSYLAADADSPYSTDGVNSIHGSVYIPAILALAASVMYWVNG